MLCSLLTVAPRLHLETVETQRPVIGVVTITLWRPVVLRQISMGPSVLDSCFNIYAAHSLNPFEEFRESTVQLSDLVKETP